VSEKFRYNREDNKKIIFYGDLNPKNQFLKLKSNIYTPKYMKDADLCLQICNSDG
jgi:hypothetical protein